MRWSKGANGGGLKSEWNIRITDNISKKRKNGTVKREPNTWRKRSWSLETKWMKIAACECLIICPASYVHWHASDTLAGMESWYWICLQVWGTQGRMSKSKPHMHACVQAFCVLCLFLLWLRWNLQILPGSLQETDSKIRLKQEKCWETNVYMQLVNADAHFHLNLNVRDSCFHLNTCNISLSHSRW